MIKISSKLLIALLSFIFFSCVSFAEEKNKCYSCKLEDGESWSKVNDRSVEDFYNNVGLDFYTGNFDFSDHKQSAVLVGMQHHNDSLFRESFLGKLTPITGGFLTDQNALYLYTGAEAEYTFGKLKINPSFAPGLYRQNDGKDLGHVLEFKTEVKAAVELGKNNFLGMSYNHISNASLGTKNPGANSYMFNFRKQF
jgi:lipid A 3-O-deacylase